MRPLVLLALLCAGCPSTAGRGLTPIWQQRVHALGTSQPCLADPEVVRVADLALVLLAREAVAAGFDYEATARAVERARVGVCLIQRPEPCCLSPGVGCQRDTDGQVTPKAGCGGEGWAWVSLEWPAGTPRDWRGDLHHEVAHALGFVLGVSQRADHQTAWSEVERRAARAMTP